MFNRSVNKVVLIGNLGKEPEIRYLANGNAVANLTLATTESWKDKQTGERQEKTEWHNLTVFNRLAELCGEYLKKGKKVYVEGKLQTRKWQGQDGQDRYSTDIVVSEIQLLDKSDNPQGQYQPPAQAQYQQPATQQNGPAYQQPQQPAAAQQTAPPSWGTPPPSGPAYQQPQQPAYQATQPPQHQPMNHGPQRG